MQLAADVLSAPSSISATVSGKKVTVRCAAVASAAKYKWAIVGNAAWSYVGSGPGLSVDMTSCPGTFRFTARAISVAGVDGALSTPSAAVTVAAAVATTAAAAASGRGASASGFGTPAWAAANKERRLPPHKHDKKYFISFGIDVDTSHWFCCWCSDKTSTYCCAPTSSTHWNIKLGWTYNGHGSQTSVSSYDTSR